MSDENGSQLSLDAVTFDHVASTAARDRSIRQVDENAEPDWKDAAYDAVRETARRQPFGFIVDEVWKLIPDDVAPPHELRAMGAIMRRAQRDGLIVPTDDFKLSARVTAHRNPRRIWRAAS